MSGGRPGRGGITRGRGDAFLRLSNETEGDTAGMQAKKLPRGAVVPKTWERIGISRVAPTTAPERANEAGSEGTTGAGEAAWRRRLAPHHRRAVRRYFSGQDAGKQDAGKQDTGGEDDR